jgi:hypothetical protein
MKVNINNTYFRRFLTAIILCFGTLAASAQEMAKEKSSRDFCSLSNFSYNNKMTVKEMRETVITAPNLLIVDGQLHGSISIKSGNRSDVLIRACIIAAGDTETEGRSLVKNIRVETGSVIKAANTPSDGWMVSYEIHVPRQTNLKLTTYHGGIEIKGVEGALEFQTTHGALSLRDVGGDVRGETMHGNVSVILSGSSWKGAGLDLVMMHGAVYVSLPENYAANIEIGTVNGTFYSNLKGLQKARKNRIEPRGSARL